ncbi:A disintegrin and metalloproteinase with thrombospondin motif 12 [Cricetulus griseus]|nr:A disintegrin and metalloproteinase with thrombospondin motif 12 [Cricetulus griseus]
MNHDILKEMLLDYPHSLGNSEKEELQREKWERKNWPRRSLSRRSISKDRWVETLVVADTKMVEYHGSENIESYILTIMNMVTGLFHNPSIGNAVHIVVVRLILLEEEEQGLKIVHHAEKTLSSFCKWQKSINPKSDLNPVHHDVAVLITRKDICAGVNRPCETLGLSQLSGMCQPHRSCNINEDSGLPLAFTIAHELGHSFGIQHDGKENDCEPVGRHPYIMSQQIQYDPTPLTWSKCSKEYITRFLEPKFGGKYCTGERKRYRLCNVHPCRSETPTFRQMQCSEFDTVPYKNEFYRWFPVFNAAYPCELYCRPIDGQFSEKMLDAVIDGTPCFEGGSSRNVCINGICKRIGCDYEIDSNATEDRCGVCLGDGSACQTVKKLFRQKEGSGYVDIGLIPKGARDIRVMEIKAAGNFLAIRSEDPEKYYLNGGFIIQWNGNYKLAGTVFQYDRKGDLEKLMAPGPTNESLWIQLLFQVTNPGVKYEYTVRKDGLDNDVDKLLYFWQFGRWTECSVSCGTGIRRQIAHCVKKGHGIVKATFCNPETQPDGRQRKCYEKDCPPRWWAGEWEACSMTCGPYGEKKRTVLCIQTMGSDEQALPATDCQHLLKPKSLVSCNRDILCPSDWTVGNWSECSVSCGGGVRIRSVTCAKNHNEPCDKTRKPNSRALCGLQQCPSSHRVLKSNKDIAPGGKNQPIPEYDPFKPIPAPTSRLTPLSIPTVPESVSRSSQAITSLGPTIAPEEEPTQTEEDSHYPTSSGSTSQVPLTSWSLSLQPDDENVSSSAIGPTSESDFWATTTSDSGLSSSNAVTWQVTPFYNTLTTDPEVEIHSGSGEDSDQPMNKDENHSVIWNKIRVPEHDSSMERNAETPLGPPPTSYVEEETSWPPFSATMEGSVPDWSLKNETPRAEGLITEKPGNIPLPLGGGQPTPSEKLENHDHLALANNTNPPQGSGPVLSEEDASILIAEGFLLNASNYKPLMKDHSPAYWIVGNWSKCSTTCGLGAYWRSVECSTGMNADCAAIQRPDPAKKCHLRPCAGWRVGNWSQCSRNCSGGFKIREIQCMDSQDHHRSLRPFHCQFLAGIPPPLSMSCNLEPCEEWQVGPWSQCTTSCGGGSQKRTVHCIPSENSTTEDQNQCLCDHEVRPPEFQKCIQQACRKSAATI